RGRDLALDPAAPEAAGDQDPVDVGEALAHALALLSFERLGVDPLDLHARVLLPGRVTEGLGDRQVGILEAHVLADDRDPRRPRRAFGAHDRLFPRHEFRLRGALPDAELPEKESV